MEKLAEAFRSEGFEFLFIYTREAHPGELFPHHATLEQKIQQAEQFRDQLNLKRTVLVDDLTGTAHRPYGSLPDMLYLIGMRTRQILYKADWTNADTLRMLLEYQVKRKELRQSNRKVGPNYCEFLGFRPRMWPQFEKKLEAHGPKALADWKEALAYWKEHPPTHG